MAAGSDPRERYAAAQSRLLERYDLADASQFADIDGPVDRVHYLQAGSGDPIVLIPGIASPTALFVPLMAEIADLGALYALERPGRALSDPYNHQPGDVREFTVAWLDATLDALDAGRVDVIASSFGGFQAFVYALARPERVGRLAFVGSPAGLSGDLPLPFRLLGVKVVNRLMFGLIAAESIDDVRATMERINVEDASALDDELLEVILAGSQIPEQTRSLKSLFETTAGLRGVTPEMLVRDEVGELDHPMLLLWGTEDYFFSPEVGHEVFRDRENAKIVELDGLGHTPWLEPANDVAARLEEFFAA